MAAPDTSTDLHGAFDAAGDALQLVKSDDGHLATVSLNRPDKLNAVTYAMWLGLGDLFSQLDADGDLRCVVLRGAGETAFAAGGDIAEFDTLRNSAAQAAQYGAAVHEAMDQVAQCRHPVVAQIYGACVGGGLELAALCDVRLAGESARFGVPVSKLGLVMAHREMQALLNLVGTAKALEILLEARIYSAADASAMGIINRVVPDSDLDAAVSETAARICAGAPLVHRWHKAFARRLQDPAPLTAEEIAEGFACFDTEDFQIGRAAFLAKQKPVFKGR